MKIAFNPSTVAALTTPPNNKDITFDLRGRNIFARGVEFKGTDTNTWRDIKINNVSIGSHTLDLRNGSNTTLTNTNGVVTINSTWRPVVDNLTSDSTTSSLSAKQGKVLKALIDGKSNSDHNHDGRYVRYYAVTTLDCNNLAAGLTAARISATNAAHTNHSAYLYISDVGTPFQIQIPDSSIPYIYKRYYGSGKWSGWFKLNAGYADSAGSVAWANVTGKPSAFNPAAHTHTVFKNNLMIKGTNGISDSASIHLGIGDSDTGFKWISDGVCQIYADNAAVGQWTSGGMNWFKNPTVNGNKVWNAGNDGSGSGLDADTLDGYHAASFVKMKQFRFNQYKAGFWTKILTITINSTSDLQPVIAFNWIPSECAREVWAEFTINWRSNSPIFYAIWKGTAVRTLTCVNSSGNIWNVWVQGDKNNYDPFGEVQVTYAHNISSYNGGSLGYSDSDPGGTRCTLGGYVNYARSTGNADTVDGQHASAFSYKSWWHWHGKDGQPNWLWGGNNENDYYVYNPSNFRVAYASSAGNADTLDGEHASSFVRAGHYESNDLNKLDTYSFIRSVNSNVSSTSPKGNTGWYNVIQLVHRNGASDGPSYIGQIALGMTTNTNDMFFRGKRTDPWKTVIHSGNYTEFINNYYWANVKISTSSSTTTSPAFSNVYLGNSLHLNNRGSNSIYNGPNDSANGVGGPLNNLVFSSWQGVSFTTSCAGLTYTNKNAVSINCRTGQLYARQVQANGFMHTGHNNNDAVLLAGGDYKTLNSIWGGDSTHFVFLGYLTLHNGVDGTISDSFMCLGKSVPFTYTRGGAYCLINIPDTSFQTFYIKAAIASVHYSGAGMGHWVGNHRGDGAWWLHCDAVGSNAVQVKGFHLANENNDSWWGGNPLYSGDGAAKIITVCLFGYVKFR